MTIRNKPLLAIVLAWAGTSCGQVITLNPVELSGSIVQVGPRNIAMKAANGQNWVLNLQPRSKIRITGVADTDMLKQGVFVRFTASIDKRTCKAQDKLDKITIFTQTPGVPERTLGVERASGHPQDNNGAQPPGPGFGPPGQPMPPAAGKQADDQPKLDPNFGNDSAGSAPKRRGGARGLDKSAPQVADYEVCAQVLNHRGTRLVVSVENRFFKPKITVDLAADAKVDLDLGDLSAAKPGDKLSAKGYYVKSGVCALVEEVEIVLSEAQSGRAHRGRPGTNVEASHRSTTKPKAAAGAAAKHTSPADSAPSDAAAKEPVESQAKSKPEPAAPLELAPPAEETKPAPKPGEKVETKPADKKPAGEKPAKKPEKKPTDDDEKDVFEK